MNGVSRVCWGSTGRKTDANSTDTSGVCVRCVSSRESSVRTYGYRSYLSQTLMLSIETVFKPLLTTIGTGMSPFFLTSCAVALRTDQKFGHLSDHWTERHSLWALDRQMNLKRVWLTEVLTASVASVTVIVDYVVQTQEWNVQSTGQLYRRPDKQFLAFGYGSDSL